MLFTSLFCHADLSEDEAILLNIHQNVLNGFLKGDLKLIYSNVSSSITEIKDGQLKKSVPINIVKEKHKTLFEHTNFYVYEDTQPPYVKVSKDGSLAWIAASVRVKANGINGNTEDLSFHAAWVELYEEKDGNWLFVGSSSSVSPLDNRQKQ